MVVETIPAAVRSGMFVEHHRDQMNPEENMSRRDRRSCQEERDLSFKPAENASLACADAGADRRVKPRRWLLEAVPDF